jgi:glycine/D-amino acid oxidase-like deaminating enzyme
MNARPIDQACFWMAGRRRAPDPPLEGRHATDIAIVGGGFTGLWTANFIKAIDPARHVTVIEKEVAAYGASGRNAGVVVEWLHHSHGMAVRHFGREAARALAALGMENLEGFFRFVGDHGIDCDLERNGQLHVALTADQVEDLRASQARSAAMGIAHLRWLDRDAVRSEVRSDRYQAALDNPHWGMVDPVKLVEGLKREVARRGVVFFEKTRVEGFDDAGAGVRVRAAGGEVTARRVVLATNAYTHTLLPRLASRFIPLYDYILVSEPLTPAQRAAIGWARRQTVSDARTFFKYYRLTADDRLLFGTSEAAYYRGNRVDADCDHSERHYRDLRASVARHFPALADLAFPYAWGGPICSTLRFIPFFGKARGGRVVYGLGYTGQGVAASHFAGRVLAHMATDRPDRLLDVPLVKKRPFPCPGEPIRSLAIAAVTRSLRRVDAGGRPGPFLRILDAMGIGLSS